MSEEPYESVEFFANIEARRSYGRRRPFLGGITKDGPSKAAGVIASVRIEVRVPRAFLDREGPPVFRASLAVSGEPRQIEVVSIDMLEEIVPPLELLRPVQEPEAP